MTGGPSLAAAGIKNRSHRGGAGGHDAGLTYTSVSGSGDVMDGPGRAGADLLRVTAVAVGGCKSAGLQLTVTGPAAWAPWTFNATSNSSTGVSGTFTLAATVSGAGCVFTTSGAVPATYTNSTRVLAIEAGGLMTDAVNTACSAWGYAGDDMSFTTNLAVPGSPSNPIAITSP